MSEAMQIASYTGTYEARFDTDGLAKLDGEVPENAHFIIDARVAELYGAQMANVLASRSVLRIEASEANKSLERFPDYVGHLVERGLRRDQVLIAIGGGIIQDITCFLAATMLRGVAWRFYPTTLLAQADSCIGSKSSINCGATKNILGTFTPPRQVVICTPFLDTLDERDIRSGVGEILKVHVIDGPDAFDTVAANYDGLFTDDATMCRHMRHALAVKQRYIEDDEFDRGPRNIFNYGHSFGHAIEAATDFAVPHGIAVTIGMDMANWISARLGVGSDDNYRRMTPVLRKNYAGYAALPVPLDRFAEALSKDKKNVGSGTVALILPDREARVFKDSYPADDNFRGLCAEFLETVRAA